MIQRPTGADMPVYAALSTMRQQPTQDEIANGVIPLDTLPANWWNWLWNTITKAQNDLQYNDEVIFTEINNVLAAGGITPNPTADAQATHDQLIRAINVIKNAVATTTTLGVVKSSDTGTDGSVRVNTGGTMTVNGFGDLATLHTVDKSTITGAINEVHDEMDALNNDLTQEIQSEASEIRGEIGTLSSLTTSAKGSTVAAINELQNEVNFRPPRYMTAMTSGGFVSAAHGYISLKEFWSKIRAKYGDCATVGFVWALASDGYVSIDGTSSTDKVLLSGATVIYNCNNKGPENTYATFNALVIPGGGITDTYVMMASTADVANTLSLKRIIRLANANEVGALSSLNTTAKSSIVAAINELQSEVNTVAGGLQNISAFVPTLFSNDSHNNEMTLIGVTDMVNVTATFTAGSVYSPPEYMRITTGDGWVSLVRIEDLNTAAPSLRASYMQRFTLEAYTSDNRQANLEISATPVRNSDAASKIKSIIGNTSIGPLGKYDVSTNALPAYTRIENVRVYNEASGYTITSYVFGGTVALSYNSNAATFSAYLPNNYNVSRVLFDVVVVWNIPMSPV